MLSARVYFRDLAKFRFRRFNNPSPQFNQAISFVRKTNVYQNYISSMSSSATDASTEHIVYGTLPRNGIDMKVGQFAELCRSFSQEDVLIFGKLIGDMNPVHFPIISHTTDKDNDDEIAYNRPNQMPIVHGMLLSSLFSAIFGTLIPGAIYRSQSLTFNNSVSVGEQVIARVTVRKLRQVRRNNNGVLCSCDTFVVKGSTKKLSDDINNNNGAIAVSGTAQVWLPGATINTA